MTSFQHITVCRSPDRLCFERNTLAHDVSARRTIQIRLSSWQLRSNASFERHHTKIVSAVSAESEVLLKNEADGKFDWFKNWWPVQAVDNLPTDRPYQVQLLGKYYVVWKGHSGEWIAMDDECPHRLAPLSEGRVEDDGNLLCSYHAWRFDGSGKCVKIPHAEDEKAHFVACNSQRSAVQTYPCKTRGAMLWIWPDKSISAFIDSENVPVPIEEDIADYLERSIVHPYVRYLPYSFDILMENLCDPSHFNISHHGLAPFLSRYKSRPLQAKLVEGMSQLPATATIQYVPGIPLFKQAQAEFRAPGVVVMYHGTKEDSLDDIVMLTATPVSAGRSLVISVNVRRSSLQEIKESSPLQRASKKLMALVGHVLFQNALYDGDSVFLHEQEKKIKQMGSSIGTSRKYYTPTTADLLVVAFRRWFENEGGYGEAYGGNKQLAAGSELTRREMLNRYELHTKHCKICRESLKIIKHFSHFLKIFSLGALFVGSLTLIRATNGRVVEWKVILKSLSLWTAIVVGLLSSMLRHLIEKNIVPLFYFKDWVHAEND